MDLTGIARHLARVSELRGDFRLVPLSEEDIDVVVVLCGCLRACGNKEEVRTRAKHNIVIAGGSLGGRAVSEECLPSDIEKELTSILGPVDGTADIPWLIS